MFMKIIAALCLLVIVWVAVKSKVRIKTRRGYRGVELPTEAKDSMLSVALAELIATAGGIYISLLLLFSFLDLAVPGKIGVVGIQVDALAGISLVTALLQPIVVRIVKRHAL
jgi:hypothetical protein